MGRDSRGEMPGLPSQLGNALVAGATMTACVSSMPQAAQRHGGSGPACSNGGVWSKHRDDVVFDQLQKFWSELPPLTRQELLRIDKQTLFEQARKNLYCSRCNGLLLECFTQIVMYGKSLHQDFEGLRHSAKTGNVKIEMEDSEDVQDPSVHPWGGLVATRDGTLSLLDCYLHRKSFWVLQNVFDCARARERERELLYPDACGGGGRGWISHGLANYGRVHGIRESCALHTARLSCDTLVDFWSALGDETRLSLLRMKEEDFIERLMYRFDSKRFCRDCRKNVIREFKELKELKRMRKETRCTRWFCVADTAFQYEVSDDTVLADWRQSFLDAAGAYHHFEWAIGTGEGKTDILEFEDVGMSGEVQVTGLDLGGLDACFITLRAWRLDGRCTELTGKAHALKGQPCVHRRLVVGDGFVAITKGENIRRFFEHAEEAEEEEDDDAIDKDGSEMDSDGSRPQKHAKSPELAREFLLDAATVIFKEQVEKAFREGTARQNAHSIFVCLALKLLEDRVHIACKEIITLEKQIKLLEEEEKEKREEEERKERRRTKEKEKKLRRKERLRGKDRDREKKHSESNTLPAFVIAQDEGSMDASEQLSDIINDGDSNGDAGEPHLIEPLSPDDDGQFSNASYCSTSNTSHHPCHIAEKNDDGEVNNSFIMEQTKVCRRKLRFSEDSYIERPYRWSDTHQTATCEKKTVLNNQTDSKVNGCIRTHSRSLSVLQNHPRGHILKTVVRKSGPRFSEKFQTPKHRLHERSDYHSCSCSQQADYRLRDPQPGSISRLDRECKSVNKVEVSSDNSRPLFRNLKNANSSQTSDVFVAPRTKQSPLNGSLSRDGLHTRQVWEPMVSRKKCLSDETGTDLDSRPLKVESAGCIGYNSQNEFEKPSSVLQESVCNIHAESEDLAVSSSESNRKIVSKSHGGIGNLTECSDDFSLGAKPCHYLKDDGTELEPCSVSPTSPIDNICDAMIGSSSSDNCSSCISEADSSTSCSSLRNTESSSTSDSEETSQHFEDVSISNQTAIHTDKDDKEKTDGSCTPRENTGSGCERDQTANASNSTSSQFGYEMNPRHIHMMPMSGGHGFHSHYVPQASVGPHHQTPVSWPSVPNNRVVPFPHSHHYLFPNPLNYTLPSLQTSDFHMHYSGPQPLGTPMVNTCQPPIYRTMRKVSAVNANEQAKGGLDLNRNLPGNAVVDTTKSTQAAERLHSNVEASKSSSSAGNGSIANSEKAQDCQPFSLFHFGGPMAASYKNSSDSTSCRNGTTMPTKKEDVFPKNDSKVEEYSLFASKTGARFSFF